MTTKYLWEGASNVSDFVSAYFNYRVKGIEYAMARAREGDLAHWKELQPILKRPYIFGEGIEPHGIGMEMYTRFDVVQERLLVRFREEKVIFQMDLRMIEESKRYYFDFLSFPIRLGEVVVEKGHPEAKTVGMFLRKMEPHIRSSLDTAQKVFKAYKEETVDEALKKYNETLKYF